MAVIRLLIWNTEWKSPRYRPGKLMAAIIAHHDPDILCLTEVRHALVPDHGSALFSGPEPGYDRPSDRCKVGLWSRGLWTNGDLPDSASAMAGRYISGVTQVSDRSIAVVGVCIPWNFAHVTSGNRNCSPWQAHIDFNHELAPVLRQQASMPHLVVGDYNQRIPRQTAPIAAYDSLMTALPSDRYRLATGGAIADQGIQLIDHCAHTQHFTAQSVQIIPNEAQGIRLSDHVGVLVELMLA
jgi:exonuclease III